MDAVNGMDSEKPSFAKHNNNNVVSRNKQKTYENKRSRSTSRYRGRKSKDKHGKCTL